MAISMDESPSAHQRSALNGSYYLSKCVLRGSVVLQVVQGHLRSPNFLDIVFGKETSIELVIIGEDGIVQSVCEQAVFGSIKDIGILHWNEKFSAQSPQMLGKDLLVVISDSGKLSFLTFCNEMHRFFPLTHVQLSNPGNSKHQLGRMLAIDSNAGFIAASAYDSRIALFSVSLSAGNNIVDKRIFYPPGDCVDKKSSIIWGTIWSMCFISKDFDSPCKGHNPVLAILLNRRGENLNELLLMEWNITEHTVRVISRFTEPGPLAQYIVEIPHSYGFAFLFRIGDALLMDLRDASNPVSVYKTTLNFLPVAVEEHNFVNESCGIHDGDDEGIFNVAARALLELGDMRVENIKGDDAMSIDNDIGSLGLTSAYVCSWCWEPLNTKLPRLIISLDTGEYYMIELFSDSGVIKVNVSDSVYEGLPCKALLWFESGFLAALVEMGDGMVLKLRNQRLIYTSPIQNIAPILDMSFADNQDAKHDQIVACCGMAPDGSLRIIRNGVSVEKLLTTPPVYQGITDTFTVRMKAVDSYQSFLVISFVEATRVLSLGLSFIDVTDSVGFQSDVCTLACGLVGDGMLVQVHKGAVRLCLPTTGAHPDGISMSSPIYMSWFPDKLSISLGAVGHNLILVATSNPFFLFVLGVRSLSTFKFEIYEVKRVRLQSELSCISIPKKIIQQKQSASDCNLVDSNCETRTSHLAGVNIGNTFVIGTHKPSVEILSFLPDRGLGVIAVGMISLTNSSGIPISGCIPQDVRLVRVDRLYVLSGLRNGMLLRFEWPSVSKMCSLATSSERLSYDSGILYANLSLLNETIPVSLSLQMGVIYLDEIDNSIPVFLELVGVRRIGITPVFLVPLSDSLDSDIIVLSGRPWLLQTARHSLTYTSISFQPSTHAIPVCSIDCPMGILFIAQNRLHLVEMVHNKRLNVEKIYLTGTPRKVLYHSESRLLLVLRTDLSNDLYSSDICCVDPVSRSVISTFTFGAEEIGKSMELIRIGNEHRIVIGTSLTSGPAIMPSGEAENTEGRLILLCLEHMQNSDSGSTTFNSMAGYAAGQLSGNSHCSSPDDTNSDGIKLEETELWTLELVCSMKWPGIALAVCPYLNRYFLASAGNAFYVCGFPNDNLQKVKKFAVARTRYMIMSLTAQFTRIVVGDCRDGVLFYSYQEDSRKLQQIYADPEQRLVADCVLIDADTAVVSDRKGSIAILSCPNQLEVNSSAETNLTLSCWYYMGEIAMRIRKGSFSYKHPSLGVMNGFDGPNTVFDPFRDNIVATTLLGSIMMFIPISREEFELLEVVQARLAVHPFTAPILGNDHNEFRSWQNRGGVKKIVDGDMLGQFLELTSVEQEAILDSPDTATSTSKFDFSPPISVAQVVQLLERVHYALN